MTRRPFPPMRVSRSRMIGTALMALVGCTGATSLAAQDVSEPTVIVAEFRDASPLLPGNDIKIHGVTVGQTGPMIVEDGLAKVVLELQPAALPLHTDARATIRPVSLLGERFLELDSGTSEAPLLASGGVIPASQTGANADLDEVLNTFDDPTAAGLAGIVATLGDGLRGNGGDLDAALKALAPAMTKTDKFVTVLREQNAVLNSLVENVEPVARSLAADNGKALDGLVASTTGLLSTTASNQAALDGTLQELPGTLVAARATLGNLADTAASTTPTLRSLRPTTENLREISEELMDFSDSADPALDAAVPMLERGRELLDEARPVVDELRAAGPDITSTTKGLRPIVRELSLRIDDVNRFVRNWAMSTNGKDGLSHYFRAHGPIAAPTAVTGGVPGVGGNLGIGKDVAPRSGQPDREPSMPGLLTPTPSSDGGATGLNQKQERDALGFLLGGGK